MQMFLSLSFSSSLYVPVYSYMYFGNISNINYLKTYTNPLKSKQNPKKNYLKP